MQFAIEKADDEHDGYGSQHSLDVHKGVWQLVDGKGDLSVSPALHEPCWNMDDTHEGLLAVQHSLSLQDVPVQTVVAGFSKIPAVHV